MIILIHCIGLIRMGITTTSHIMQHCVTWHFSQQCMADRATWMSFYYHFIVVLRHPVQTIVNFYSITPPFTFFSHCYYLHFICRIRIYVHSNILFHSFCTVYKISVVVIDSGTIYTGDRICILVAV